MLSRAMLQATAGQLFEVRSQFIGYSFNSNGTSPIDLNTNFTITPGDYIIIVSGRHNTASSSRSVGTVDFWDGASVGSFTELVSESRVSSGAGGVWVGGIRTTLDDTNIDIRVVTSSGDFQGGGVGIWLWKVTGLDDPTIAWYTGSSDGSSFQLGTPLIPVNSIIAAACQGTNGVTYDDSHGSGSVDTNIAAHETNREGHALLVDPADQGLDLTNLGLSANNFSAGCVIRGRRASGILLLGSILTRGESTQQVITLPTLKERDLVIFGQCANNAASWPALPSGYTSIDV